MDTCGLFVQANSVLQSALYACIQRVQAVERQRLRRPEAPPREAIRPVVGQDAVGESMQLRLREVVEAPGPLGHQLVAKRHMAYQRAGLAEGDLRAEIELERLAGVVQDRRAQEEVRVQPRVQRRGLEG